MRKNLFSHAAFCMIGCSGAFVTCAYMENEEPKKRTLFKKIKDIFYDSQQRENLKKKLLDIPITIQELKEYKFNLESLIRLTYNEMSDKNKTIGSLMALNCAIFLSSRMFPSSTIISKIFINSIQNHPITQLGSVFMHGSFLHLGCNMLALYQFGPMLYDLLGQQQFLAFYLSAGMISSFGSLAFRFKKQSEVASVGASGSLFAVLGYLALAKNIKVSLIFLPLFPLELAHALIGVATIDIIGLIKNWQFIDHAAHLSGVIFGYIYYTYGQKMIWDQRHQWKKYFNN